ncbi:hypothetical protein RUND412_003243 [Rhizina undulata]
MSIPVAAFLAEPLKFLLSLSPASKLIQETDHFFLHPAAPFEGYYTRIQTDQDATILVIFSSVRNTKNRPHYLHFSYIPDGISNGQNDFQFDIFPDIAMAPVKHDPKVSGIQEFSCVARNQKTGEVVGRYIVGETSQQCLLHLAHPSRRDEKINVSIHLSSRTPWKHGKPLSTPEGVFSNLVHLLPLHWNVFSTSSVAEYTISCSTSENSAQARTLYAGTGKAHLEKNWGASFPRGWCWIQAFSSHASDERSFALAGGKILGQKAYLLGYRSARVAFNFKPPYTIMPFAFPTPFIAESHDSKKGRFKLEVSNFSQRLMVDVEGPPNHEGYIALHCPLSDGHNKPYAYETFEAVIRIQAFERRSLLTGGQWQLIDEAIFEKAALEFGGDYSFMNGA